MTRGESAPLDRDTDVVLRDGSTVRVRPAERGDLDAVRDFLVGLSPEARARRYFSGSIDFDREADRAVGAGPDRLALLALAGNRVVGHGMWVGEPAADRAEVAQAIADDFQGLGLGTIMLGELAAAADARGVHSFVAEVLPENHQMIEVYRESGFPVSLRSQPGWILAEFPTSLTPEALERFARREDIASVAAVRAFLEPRSVAVIGASRRAGSIGGQTFGNLLSSGFAGPVYPVNQRTGVVGSVRAFPTVADVPDRVDLAIVVVPASDVAGVARQCAGKGVRALLVLSAGFAETGPEGAERQRDLLSICRSSGMRLVGPNCMGLLSTAPGTGLNATFAPDPPPPGTIGFLSQSGALGLAVLEHCRANGLGLSSFVSVGNKADLSSNDLLRYWEQDERTRVILLYLESFGNPRTFGRLSRRIGRTKPIVAVKSGASTAGARAASSHTGALVASSDAAVDALFHQAGVIRTRTLGELLGVASLLADQPPPGGRRVGVLTNGGGLGILCADACEADGLEVPGLSPGTRTALAEFLPAEASLGNPIDMIATAGPPEYGRALAVLAGSGEVDSIVVIFVRPPGVAAGEVARAVAGTARDLAGRVPVLAVFMTGQGAPAELRSGEVRVPCYDFPEQAARALARTVRYGEWRARPPEPAVEHPEARHDQAAGLIARALERGPGWLPPPEVRALVACYGVPFVEEAYAPSAAAAGRAAAASGGPVALKAVVRGMTHKSDIGGVALDVAPPAVAREAGRMRRRLAERGLVTNGFVVQRMAPPGVEMLVGVVQDPSFGPVIAAGAGGTSVELIRDVAVRLAPLAEGDADEMLRSLMMFPLLEGYRGSRPVDAAALRDVILRVGDLAAHHPAIAEMDCNPVIVHPGGAVVVDARIRLEPPAAEPPIGSAGGTQAVRNKIPIGTVEKERRRT